MQLLMDWICRLNLKKTRKRMLEMEKQVIASDPNEYDDLLKQAQDAEKVASTKIQNLISALRKSEELRKETEGLLNIANDASKSVAVDATDDPQVKGIGN